jgi:hypothetical protein
MKKFLVTVVLVALLSGFGYLAVRTGLFSSQHAGPAGGESRRLAEEPETVRRAPKPEESADVRVSIEGQTAKLRGLAFKEPVTYKMIERKELRLVLEQQVHEQYTEAELRDYSRSLVAIGLVPAGTDVLRVLMGLYGEQVAAFYIPEQHALYTFKDQAWTGSMDRMVLSHELVHALQDQHFDVGKLPLKLKTNDDMVLATAALVEGDATVLMTHWYANHAEPGGMLQDLLSVFAQNTAALGAAPEFLRESLVFPYQEGQRFVSAIVAAGGMEAVNKAFASPPVSTEQVLHPAKYLGQRDDPVEVTPSVEAPAGWRRIGDNVLGEWGVRGLLKGRLGMFEAQVAAMGWEGDRYRVYERGADGPVGVVWESVWETEDDARELVAAYEKGLVEADRKGGWTTQVFRDKTRVVVLKAQAPEFLESGAGKMQDTE